MVVYYFFCPATIQIGSRSPVFFYGILGLGLFGVLSCSSRCTDTVWGNWSVYRNLVFSLEGDEEVKLPQSFYCAFPSPVLRV